MPTYDFQKQTAAPIFDRILNDQRQNHELVALRDLLLPMLKNGQVTVV